MRNLYTATAIAVGGIVLFGYFIQVGIFDSLRRAFLEWAVILTAVAVLVGIANLFQVHWRKLISGGPSSLYSAVLLISLAGTLAVVLWFGPNHLYSMWIFNHIQVPIESSLLALLAVILILAAIRMVRRRPGALAVLFILVAVIILLASGPLFGLDVQRLADIRSWIAQVPAAAGARGILLGVALGIIATGLRVLLPGGDRPYGGG
jgi:hypothetical protein